MRTREDRQFETGDEEDDEGQLLDNGDEMDDKNNEEEKVEDMMEDKEGKIL